MDAKNEGILLSLTTSSFVIYSLMVQRLTTGNETCCSEMAYEPELEIWHVKRAGYISPEWIGAEASFNLDCPLTQSHGG
jgi:hypothetical protein